MKARQVEGAIVPLLISLPILRANVLKMGAFNEYPLTEETFIGFDWRLISYLF